MPLSPQEQQELAQLENKRSKGGGRPPLGFVAKQIWGMMPQNPKNIPGELPMIGGAIGGLSPLIGGATLGTGIGQAGRDFIYKKMGKPIPSGLQHVGELGLGALSDVSAIPAIKGRFFGKQIGAIEKARGVAPTEDIPSLSRPAGPEKVSTTIDDNIRSVKEAQKGGGTPEFWKQIKDQVDWMYQRGKDLAVSGADRLKLRWLSKAAEEGLNKSVSGRAVPAKALARSQTIPRFAQNVMREIPSKYKIAGAVGGGVGIPLGLAEILKKFLGG